ncbi:hypothetical protein SAMN05444169_5068 [Bradyrhizobium erythrophlei]|uniref:Uncharacterized protein n=1 Tax=Bradyrhizobium erythrophlei TaxID=1437360 RepID=A0A1M5P786_9BRAD|nr:hypothetical protein SAMN05444169_5068 [Bradyrhizobium erythrophlei]
MDPTGRKGRRRVWNSRRGNHLGQRSYARAPTGRTYGRKRSDQIIATTALRGGGRPHMGSRRRLASQAFDLSSDGGVNLRRLFTPCARGDALCAEPGRSHPCPDSCAGPAWEGDKPHAEHVYVDEKSDEAIVLAKRLNKGRQLPAEVVEGRASLKGNSRQAAAVRTLSRNAASIRMMAARRATSVTTSFVARRLTRGRSPVR